MNSNVDLQHQFGAKFAKCYSITISDPELSISAAEKIASITEKVGS